MTDQDIVEVGGLLLEYYNLQLLEEIRAGSRPADGTIFLTKEEGVRTIAGKPLDGLLSIDQNRKVRFEKISMYDSLYKDLASRVESAASRYFEEGDRCSKLHPVIGKLTVIGFKDSSFAPKSSIRFHTFGKQKARDLLKKPESFKASGTPFLRILLRVLIYLYDQSSKAESFPKLTTEALELRRIHYKYDAKIRLEEADLEWLLDWVKDQLRNRPKPTPKEPILEVAVVYGDDRGQATYQSIYKKNNADFERALIRLRDINAKTFKLQTADLTPFTAVCFLLNKEMFNRKYSDDKLSFLDLLELVARKNEAVTFLLAYVDNHEEYDELRRIVDESSFGPLIREEKIHEPGLNLLFRKIAGRVEFLSSELARTNEKLHEAGKLKDAIVTNLKKKEADRKQLSEKLSARDLELGSQKKELASALSRIQTWKRLFKNMSQIFVLGGLFCLIWWFWPEGPSVKYSYIELLDEQVDEIPHGFEDSFEPFYIRFLDNRFLLVSNTFNQYSVPTVLRYDTDINPDSAKIETILDPELIDNEPVSGFGVIDRNRVIVMRDNNQPPFLITLDEEGFSNPQVHEKFNVQPQNDKAQGDAIDVALNDSLAIISYYRSDMVFLLNLTRDTNNVTSINLKELIEDKVEDFENVVLKPSGVAFHYKKGSDSPVGFVTCLNIDKETVPKIIYIEIRENGAIGDHYTHPHSEIIEYLTDIRIVGNNLVATSDSDGRVYTTSLLNVSRWKTEKPEDVAKIKDIYSYSEGGTPADIILDPSGTRMVVIHQQNARVDVMYLQSSTSLLRFERIEEYSFTKVLLDRKNSDSNSKKASGFKARGGAVRWEKDEIYITDEVGGRLFRLEVPLN
ncbi:hypothetical protein [Lewinella sp. W8]|uniref:hypothetical protein n=1 Tax=Lewinella sp. W8 TaxID=2528208 RepID=UPI001067E8B3|nr:hypothetical protein [Lewinella sp. W8]MTB50058.1 hypothetical protein [Lewinella sp. W8]